ncbi:MAG: SDR family oxidoreductase [Planctomycetota bacterium]
MPPINLTDKPIAITGASSGIGRATALACARAGMPVVLGARRLDRLEALVAEIKGAGGRAIAVAMNVDLESDCRMLIDRTVESFGGIYSVFANAGFGLEGAACELTNKQWLEIMQTNFWGTVFTVRPAVERMLAAGKGHVLICSSCVSKVGLPLHSAYSATKAMQDHLGRAMRIELAPKGIHVSTVHPIGTVSEFSDKTAELSGGTRKAIRTPDRMKQTADVVAAAVVRCLRRPRGEVWTSTRMRLALAAMTAFPELGDWYLARRLRSRQ